LARSILIRALSNFGFGIDNEPTINPSAVQ
jgi:hypothetical protein